MAFRERGRAEESNEVILGLAGVTGHDEGQWNKWKVESVRLI